MTNNEVLKIHNKTAISEYMGMTKEWQAAYKKFKTYSKHELVMLIINEMTEDDCYFFVNKKERGCE